MKRKIAERKRLGAYEKHQEIGRGTYGTVYAGLQVAPTEDEREDNEDGAHRRRRVAIKKVVGRHDVGKREAGYLKLCRDASHVVQILDVVEQDGKMYLILEYMDSDLEAVLEAKDDVPELPITHVKTYLHMLLQGVAELHERRILHRDLKPNNLLLSLSQRTAKITDFGMATTIHDPKDDDGDAAPTKRSIQVVTRAYRAPELFFGEEQYGFEIDVWSVGCIFAELLLRKPFFDGALSDIDQLSRIFQALGSPAENGWHDAAKLPFYLNFKDTHPKPLSEQFPHLSSAGVDLLSQMLQLDPKKRISVQDALKHAFFQEEPLQVDPSELVIPEIPERQLQVAGKASSSASAQSGSTRPMGAAAAEVIAVMEENDNEHTFMIKGRRIV
uniref:Cyclin-dependent kinase 2 homolog n=1 Tax=Globisporangium ultimum (strain ATCC 200006 / CBS 805.95 / DAOM BR144) TaxID=431595 RepID=K3WBT7_GLOUD